MTSSWGSINFLTGLGKPVYFLDYWYMTKDIKDTNERPDEGYIGQSLERSGTQELLALWIARLACGCDMVHQPEALQTLGFWVFLEAPLHRHDGLNHWP